MFDAEHTKSYVVVVDAHDMTEVAKLHLPHHVPAGELSLVPILLSGGRGGGF